MDLFTFVEFSTQVLTYLSIAGGLPACYNMIKTGNTHGMPYPFFLVGLVNSLSGIVYGILVENSTFVQINVIASTFNTGYVLSFILVSKQKSGPVQQLGVCAAILACLYIYVKHIIDESKMMDTFGIVLLTFSTLLMLTPLLQVRQCVAEKSASSISLALLVSTGMCSFSWLAYGLLLNDVYIYAPNVIAMFSGLCQIAVLVMYGNKPVKKKE